MDVPRALSAETRLVVLLGDPVAHSRSPHLHNAAFQADGIDWAYLACRVAPGREAEAVAGLRALSIAGANVTVPHKEAVLPHLDDLSDGARAIGAVNTIVRDGDRLTGHNTDVTGFLEPLQPHADRLRGAEMVILGAGGAARAVAYGLLASSSPTRLTLAARTTSRAEAVAEALAPYDAHGALDVVGLPDAGARIREAMLVVNATPVGMGKGAAQTPWPGIDDFRSGHLVYDLVYTPRPTRLLREAATQGADTLDGWPMLIYQAAAAYRLWTGRPMPPSVLHSSLSAGPR